MSINRTLVIVKNGLIAFPRYYLKSNQMPTQLAWLHMLEVREGNRAGLEIPLLQEVANRVGRPDHDENFTRRMTYHGAKAIVIADNGEVYERIWESGKYITDQISTDIGSFYVRSGHWGLESAATAACLLYHRIEKAYTAALRASGTSFTPFFYGDPRLIGAKIKAMRLVEGQHRELMIKYPNEQRQPAKIRKEVARLREEMRLHEDNFIDATKLISVSYPVALTNHDRSPPVHRQRTAGRRPKNRRR